MVRNGGRHPVAHGRVLERVLGSVIDVALFQCLFAGGEFPVPCLLLIGVGFTAFPAGVSSFERGEVMSAGR